MRIAVISPQLIGKRLGKSIVGADGRPLLTAGTVLTAAYLDALVRRGFSSVCIDDELTEGIEVGDAVSEETRQRATLVVRETMERITTGARDVNLTRARAVVADIISELNQNTDMVHDLSLLRSVDSYTFTHSVNVCVYCLIIGISLGYSRDDLLKLGLGALLHDLGKTQVAELVTKPAALSAGEFERVKEHAEAGYDMIRERREVSLLSAHVAFQHHERLDGSGYPRGLKGDEIHEFGRVAAIADIFDAASADKPYRKGLPPLEVAQALMGMAGSKLDPFMVRKFLGHIALYPTGTIVVLNGGRVGVVAAQNPANPMRPVVRVLTDDDGNLTKPQDVDLATNPDLQIRAVLTDYPARVYEQIRDLRARRAAAAGAG